jgi:hypothetical protein
MYLAIIVVATAISGTLVSSRLRFDLESFDITPPFTVG